MKTTKLLIICFVSLFVQSQICFGELDQQQMYSLLNQANEAFSHANAEQNQTQQQNLYEKAILNFEKLITETNIENSKLYYNLANAYFLKGDLAKAILNYRRAQNLDSSDPDIEKNLSFARSRSFDQFKIQTEEKVLKTLFFWHYDFSIKTRFVLGCIFFASLCISLSIRILRNKGGSLIAVSIISFSLTGSL